MPSSKGVSWGPNIIASHISILSSVGAPLTPAGGSSYKKFYCLEINKIKNKKTKLNELNELNKLYFQKFKI